VRRYPSICLVVVALAATACSGDVTISKPAVSPTPSATPTPAEPVSPTPAAEAGRCGPDVYPEPDPDRPRYEMRLHLDGGTEVTGTTSVEFSPDLPTGRLFFRLWPNAPTQAEQGARLATGEVTVDGARARSRQVDPTTLMVPLQERLQPGDGIDARVRWRLQIPGAVADRLSLDGRSYRLGSFFPILPWVPGEGWALDSPTTSFAEANISPIADFDVTVDAPKGFEVLASGEEVSPGLWRAKEVRDFALAAGPFDIATGTAKAPDKVEVRVGVDRSIGAAPKAWVQQVVAGLEELAGRFGDYPWPTLNLAIMNSLSSSGIEYPTMVFQGPETLGQTTSHELAHMWFYSLVGSNPARDPWLDEGVTSWAESTVQDSLSEFLSISIPAEANGEMGRPMTYWDGQTGATYYLGVYAQGVQALGNLGRPREVNCALRAYVADNAYAIAEPEDLLDALEPLIPRARKTLERFGARF
jgi:hypothetical protein